jgi:hypothetical protein
MDDRRPPPEMSNFYCLPGKAGGTPMVLGNDDKRRIIPKTSDSDMAVTVIGRHLMSTLFVYLVSEETPS